MKIAGTIRKNLGLTQHQLATFIGTDRSLVARTETGERQLNGDALLNLLALYEAEISARSPQAGKTIVDASLREEFKFQAMQSRTKYAALKQKLTAMEERFMQANRLHHCLLQLNQWKGSSFNARQLNWMEEQLYQAELKQKQNSSGEQKKISISMHVLLASAELYETAGNEV